jgi:cation diffusion facilitator CzcD-associated flavoprotein CzcO
MVHAALPGVDVPPVARPATRVVVVGAGFAGIGLAIGLKRAGIHDFVVLERAADVGGTWRENRYPGAACDVESHLYSYSFEPNPNWTRQFTTQPEILEYIRRSADKYGILPHIRFRSEVSRAVFDERSARWTVETTAGESFSTRVLVTACGPLTRPALPDIAGLASFAGRVFHSAEWDDRAPIDGANVAVVGTGASAIQIVPAIAPRAARLHVIQRTPPWILPKPDRPIAKGERALFRRWPLSQRIARWSLYWRHEVLAVGFTMAPWILRRFGSRMARAFLARSVKDAALRTRLLPSYAMGCKRILPSNDYYPALERDNVELVTDAIREITPQGIVLATRRELAVDTIVLATGFRASEDLAPFDVRGVGGLRLDQLWATGAEAYLGTTVAGFPNFFVLIGPNTGLGHSSLLLMMEAQVSYIVDTLRTMRACRLKWVDVRPEVQASYNEMIQARLKRSVWASGCHSWYLTRTGRNTTLWPGFTFEYRFRTRRFALSDYRFA